MKYLTGFLFILMLFLNCGELEDDPSEKFPRCVGITGSFDPYHIVNPYHVKISGDTTFYTQFIFTDFKDYDFYLFLPVPTKGSWNMYIKFTRGTTILFQESFCYFSTEQNNFYSWTSGMDQRERYITWDFFFETFDCSELSGNCIAIRPDIQDTLRCRFEGSR